MSALYFGGATANLTPPDAFRRTCRRLRSAFDLSEAEVTLEGAPIYFVKQRLSLMDILTEELGARHHRISMGIQTFDEGRLRQMGRLAFGTASTFREVVEAAHQRGFSASADLLFDLPHQQPEEMRRDVEQALDLGIDHLGLYHLVLFAGLGTEWSKDKALLAGLPTNEAAAQNWLQLRDLLISSGFAQTTLTNFEPSELRGRDDRFLYEELSFQPDRHDVIGFGPTAISFTSDGDFRRAVKSLNPESSSAYLTAESSDGGAATRFFSYGRRDLRILYLTRRLAALDISRPEYRKLFGSDAVDDFPAEFDALCTEGLIEVTDTAIRPTPIGMFHADSIAGLLANQQLLGRRLASRLRLTRKRTSPPLVRGFRDRVTRWMKSLAEPVFAVVLVLVVVPVLILFLPLHGLTTRWSRRGGRGANDNSHGHM